MDILFLDYETRSESDLPSLGSHKYCMHPTTEVLLLAYAFNDDPVQVVERDAIPHKVWEAFEDDETLKVAHNAEFDMCVTKYVLGIEVVYNAWFDTAYQAAYYGYPRKLADLAHVLKTTQKASQEELKLFSTPKPKVYKRGTSAAVKEHNRLVGLLPTEWATKETNPAEWERFVQYAAGDVVVMRECFRKMVALPQIELDAMRCTFEMNFNGVPFDADLANRIMTLVHEYETSASEEALRVYGIANLRSTQQVQAALRCEGVYLPSLNSKERSSQSHPILDLRDRATGAAFRKLPKAMSRACPDGRIHGEFLGYGAHTGRWSSRGVQLQNWARILSEVREDLSGVRDYGHLRQHLRLCLGHDERLSFSCADLSQIEARIVAYMAGCTWRMEAFANGNDIYARSAEKMFGLPKVTKDMIERQYGKNAELGFGFGGSGKALSRINLDFYLKIGEAKAQELNQQWRAANPEIVALWYKLDRAFKDALNIGKCQTYCNKMLLSFVFDGKTMRVGLPSGRALYYRNVSKTPTQYGYDVQYMDYSDGCVTWHKLWHGTVVENIVQAIARDVLLEAVIRACKRIPCAQIIGSVHDEAWFLHEPGIPMLDIMLEEMARPIKWAQGLVTKGDGFTSDRYRK